MFFQGKVVMPANRVRNEVFPVSKSGNMYIHVELKDGMTVLLNEINKFSYVWQANVRSEYYQPYPEPRNKDGSAPYYFSGRANVGLAVNQTIDELTASNPNSLLFSHANITKQGKKVSFPIKSLTYDHQTHGLNEITWESLSLKDEKLQLTIGGNTYNLCAYAGMKFGKGSLPLEAEICEGERELETIEGLRLRFDRRKAYFTSSGEISVNIPTITLAEPESSQEITEKEEMEYLKIANDPLLHLLRFPDNYSFTGRFYKGIFATNDQSDAAAKKVFFSAYSFMSAALPYHELIKFDNFQPQETDALSATLIFSEGKLESNMISTKLSKRVIDIKDQYQVQPIVVRFDPGAVSAFPEKIRLRFTAWGSDKAPVAGHSWPKEIAANGKTSEHLTRYSQILELDFSPQGLTTLDGFEWRVRDFISLNQKYRYRGAYFSVEPGKKHSDLHFQSKGPVEATYEIDVTTIPWSVRIR